MLYDKIRQQFVTIQDDGTLHYSFWGRVDPENIATSLSPVCQRSLPIIEHGLRTFLSQISVDVIPG